MGNGNVYGYADRLLHPLQLHFLGQFKKCRWAKVSLTWVGVNVSELNDTVVEAELRTLHTLLHLPLETAVGRFRESKNRLLILVCLLFFDK